MLQFFYRLWFRLGSSGYSVALPNQIQGTIRIGLPTGSVLGMHFGGKHHSGKFLFVGILKLEFLSTVLPLAGIDLGLPVNWLHYFLTIFKYL